MDIALIALVTLIASAVGTLTGFGSSTIMVPARVLFDPLPQTLLLVGIVHWFGDIWKCCCSAAPCAGGWRRAGRHPRQPRDSHSPIRLTASCISAAEPA
jgi:hypothetical protein